MKPDLECVFLFSNVNGFKGKSTSFSDIVQRVGATVVVICETKLANVNKIKEAMPGHEVIDKCVKDGKGGLVIAVKKNFFGSFINVTMSQENENILVGKVAIGDRYVRIIACYAPQENDIKDVREQFFEDLSLEVTKSRLSEDEFIIMGDLNAKICMDSAGAVVSESGNGCLLQQMVSEQELSVINFSSKCSGKWTHEIRTTGQKSVLDYVLTSDRFYNENVSGMTIDETCLICPFSLKRVKGKDVVQYSDHNTILMNTLLPRFKKSKKEESCQRWRIDDEGLSHFHEITDICSGTDVSSYDEFDEYLREQMNESFKPLSRKRRGGNVSNKNRNYQHVISPLMKIYRRGKVQRKVVKQYLDVLRRQNEENVSKEKARQLTERMQQLTIDEKLSLDGFWKLKKKYVNKSSVVSSVLNENGVEICSESGILHEYRNEFYNRLQPSEIAKEWKKFEELTVRLSALCVEVSGSNKSPDFTDKELDRAISELKSGKSYPDSFPPEVFIHGGKELRRFLLQVSNRIKNEQKIPIQWMQMKIATMYKKKGSMKMLVNQRGIFLTPVISKVFEKMVKSRIVEIVAKVTKLQAGSRNERMTMDQTFLLRSGINHAVYMNQPIFITMYDFRQCFDKIWLEDALISLWKLGVRDDMLKLISLLNEKSEVVVKTSVGETEKFELGSNAKQGTVLGPILSSASIAECCTEQKKGGATVGSAVVRSLAFVDDLAGVNQMHLDVHVSHDKVTLFSRKKRLGLNEEKCIVLPINVPNSMANPVLYVNGQEMDIVELAKYLGDIFNSRGTNHDLINDRVDKGIKCMIISMALASEITLGIYLLKTLISLYKIMFLPVVLFNSGAWNNIAVESLSKLRVVQLKYLKRMLHTPTSTANCIVYLELGILPIEYNIHINQLQFLYHILSLETDDPVRENYEQQKLYLFEQNWFNEVNALRGKYVIKHTDEEITSFSKEKWKSVVHSSVIAFALKQLNDENSCKSKTSHLPPYSALVPQSYLEFLRPADARLFFAIRSGTLDIKTTRKYNYDDGDVLCRLCGQDEETVEHIVNSCPDVFQGCRNDRVNLPNVNDCADTLRTVTVEVEDVFSPERDSVEVVLSRVKKFKELSDEREKDIVPVNLGNT